MKKVSVVLAAVAVVALYLVADGYLERRTTKIDEAVTIVTLDEYVIVRQRSAPTQITRVRPAVVPARDIKPDPAKPATIKWTLSYSCNDVKYYASHFNQTQLDAMRKAAGMTLPNADQQKQIRACVAGRLPTG